MHARSFVMLAVLASMPVFAADPVTDAMQDAYAPYRAALFKTNSNAPAEARQAIGQAQQAWKAIIARYAAKPAAPYDRDARFAASLEEVAHIYDKAATQISAGEITEAHETLEAARDVMAQLRERNNVIVFSDHMNAYHAQMERVLTEGPKLLGSARDMAALTAQAGALEYLAERLASGAPSALRGNEEFRGALAAVSQSVADLRAALLSGETTGVKEALGKLKVPYSRMFLKFG